MCYSDNCDCHTLMCGHTICKSCVKQWFTTSPEPDCPMCRAPLNFKGLHRVRERWEDEANSKRSEEHYGRAFDRTLEEWGDAPQACLFALISLERNFNQIINFIPVFDDDTIEYCLDPSLEVTFPHKGYIRYDDFDTWDNRRSILVSKHPAVRAYQSRIMCA